MTETGQNKAGGERDSRAAPPQRVLGGELPLIRVLMVEDDPAYARIAASILLRSSSAHFEVSMAATRREGERHLTTSRPDVVLLDLTLSDSSGMDTVRHILDCAGDVPVVILTGLDSEKMAIEAIQAGAKDYIVKGRDPQSIIHAVRYAVERGHSERRLRETEGRLRDTQLQLIQSEKMESLGRLAAGVAHEVKNPLAVLLMGIEHLEPLLGANPEALETTGMMKDAVQRASIIIQRLLSYAAPSQCERGPADLHAILRRALAMSDYELRKKNITANLDLDEPMPSLQLDATAIEQALINLILNAAQASPEGATLTITTRQTTLTEPGGDVGRRATDRFPLGIRVVQCDVEDEGAGIPAEVGRRLFEPFFTTRPQGEGTGLGLCVTRNILDLHGGKVELLNRPEGGTCARITLIP